jgi:hypothetical protein
MSRQDVFIAIKVGGAGDAAQMFDELADRLAKIEDKLEDTEKQAKKTGGGMSKLGGIAKMGVTAGFNAAGIAAAKFVAGLAAVVAGTAASLEAFKEQDAVNRDLADSLRRAGLEGEALQQAYDKLQASAANLASDTLFGDEDILAAQAKYIQLTGDAALSTERMNTILGLASKQQIDTKAAAEKYAKALKGEVDSLKELTPVTKKQAEELAKMTDESAKAALAEKILAEAFGGTAQAISPTFNATKNLSDAKGDLLQKIGEVIERSGVIPVILDPVTRAFRWVESSINDNSEAIQHYIIDGVQMAIDKLIEGTEVVEDWREEIAAGYAVVKGFGLGLHATQKIIQILIRSVGVFASTALAGLIDGLGGFIKMAADAAEIIGDDGLAMQLRGAVKAAESLSGELEDFAADQIVEIGEDAEGVAESFDAIGEAIGDIDKNADALGNFVKAGRKELEGVNRELIKTRKEVKKLGEVPGGTGGAGAKGDPAANQIKINAEKARQRKIQDEINALKLQSLLSDDEEIKLATEYQVKLLEIEKQKLKGSDKELAAAQANFDLQQKLLAINEREQTRIDDLRKEAQQDELDRIKDLQEAEQARFDAVLAAYDQLASTSSGFFTEEAGAGGALAGTIGTITAAIGKLTLEVKDHNTSLEQGADAAAGAIATAGQAAAAGAKAAGASVRKEAIILGFFEAALAAAAVAKGIGGNPAGFVEAAQHGIASAAFFSTAAKAGGGGGGATAGASATGGRSSGSSRSTQREVQRQQDSLSDTLEELLGDSSRQITIINDNRGALFGAQAEDEVAQMSARGLSRRGYDVQQLNARRR